MLVLAFYLMCAANAESHEQAVLTHAQAQLAEHAGNFEAAIVAARQAHNQAPNDDFIAFDLARLALSHPEFAQENDTADFVSLPPVNADARVLLAYLLALRNDAHAAQDQVDEALALEPAHSEALAARSMLKAFRPATNSGLFGGRLRVSGEYDTNVTLLPQDVPSQQRGLRGAVDALVRLTPLRGTVQLEIDAQVRAAVHVLDRDALKPYDLASGAAWALLTWDLGTIKVTADAVGSFVYAGEQREPFVRDGYGLVEVRAPVSDFAFGGYGLAGYRSFGFGNLAGDNSRTGAHEEVGGLAEWQSGAWALAARTGFVNEAAHGVQQRVRGATAALLARWATGDFIVGAALNYAYRDYFQSSYARRDHVLEPALQGTYVLTGGLSVFASYAFIYNRSLAPFTYSRQLVEAGLELAW